MNMQEREALKNVFLNQSGWAQANRQPIAGDASTRAYSRLVQADGTKAILMDAPPASESAACPPDSTPQQRRALGYNAAARLAGPNLGAFLAIAKCLRELGLNAPEIYAADATNGFAIISDLGTGLYAATIAQQAKSTRPAFEQKLYERALDALLHIGQNFTAPHQIKDYVLMEYDLTALLAEIDLLQEFYIPFMGGNGSSLDDKALYAWREVWTACLNALSPPSTLVLRDYHAENLLWCPQEKSLRQVGIIDFQDGLFGQAAYDLVSLLEDARRDVSPEMVAHLYQYYCDKAAVLSLDFNEQQFACDYAILGAQRNAKILGIFARLITRDNKPSYGKLIPRVRAHMQRNLAHPLLGPVRAWFQTYTPELALHNG